MLTEIISQITNDGGVGGVSEDEVECVLCVLGERDKSQREICTHHTGPVVIPFPPSTPTRALLAASTVKRSVFRSTLLCQGFILLPRAPL